MSVPTPGASGEVCPTPSDAPPPRTDLTALGEWARRRRVSAGLSQVQVAQRAGAVHQSTVSRVERGRLVPAHQLDRIVTALLGELRTAPRPLRTAAALQDLRHAIEADLHDLLEDLVPEWDGEGRRLSMYERVRLLVIEYREMESFLHEDLSDDELDAGAVGEATP